MLRILNIYCMEFHGVDTENKSHGVPCCRYWTHVAVGLCVICNPRRMHTNLTDSHTTACCFVNSSGARLHSVNDIYSSVSVTSSSFTPMELLPHSGLLQYHCQFIQVYSIVIVFSSRFTSVALLLCPGSIVASFSFTPVSSSLH